MSFDWYPGKQQGLDKSQNRSYKLMTDYKRRGLKIFEDTKEVAKNMKRLAASND
jgi:Ser/Thr protein kinase RdoA (MazF antagonist)